MVDVVSSYCRELKDRASTSRKLIFQSWRCQQLLLVATQRRRPSPGVGSAGPEARAASSAFPDYIPHNAAVRDRLVSEVGEGLGPAGRRSGSGLRGTRRVESPRAGNHLVGDSQAWPFSIPTWRLLRKRRTQLTPANRLSLRRPSSGARWRRRR